MDSSAIIERMNRESRGTLMASLGIEFTGVGENWLEAKMPIDERTMRPGNLLHGGAIMALVETVGSGLTYIGESLEENHVFGIEINANHVRKAQGKYVIGRAEFIHKGQDVYKRQGFMLTPREKLYMVMCLIGFGWE